MIQPPKEMDIEDFNYFLVVKNLMVAGVYAEDKDNVYAIHLKGQATKKGAVMSCPKKDIQAQVEEGVTFIIKSPEEAMAENLTNIVSEEHADFVKKRKNK